MKIWRYFRVARAWRTFATALRLMRSPRVPLPLKLVTGLLALLILSPLNILGDIPVLGLFDDVALLSLLAGWFVGLASRYDAVAEPIEGELLATPRRARGDNMGRLPV